MRFRYGKPDTTQAKERSARMAEQFQVLCKAVGVPVPELEHKLYKHDTKRNPFLFDFAWPDYKVAMEMDGGVFTRGAHGSVSGILRDIRKANEAASQGWLLLRCIPSKLLSGETLDTVRRTLAVRKDGA